MEKRRVRRCFMALLMVLTLTALPDPRVAQASTIEKWLIMPGPVVSSHADVEDDCASCHDPLSDQPQYELCVVCHVEVGGDISNQAGFHGRLPVEQHPR